MNDQTHQLMRLRGHLQAAMEAIDRLADETPASEDERRVIGVTAASFDSHLPRTRADMVRFAEAVNGGDEGWIVARSVPGEHRVDAVYLAKMPTAVRRHLDI